VLGSKVIEQDEQISLLRQELREVKQKTQEIQSNLEKRAEEYERAIAALQK
jgi:nitrate reductase assembly molybdenum cofactor insertion protein NarJ